MFNKCPFWYFYCISIKYSYHLDHLLKSSSYFLISKKTVFIRISSLSLNYLQFRLHHFWLFWKRSNMKQIGKCCCDLELFKFFISIIWISFIHPHFRHCLIVLVTKSQFSSIPPSLSLSTAQSHISLPSSTSGPASPLLSFINSSLTTDLVNHSECLQFQHQKL